MARFFKSPADLVVWLKKNCSDAPEASAKMTTLTGSRNQEQDIVESVRRIFANEDTDGASVILYDILSQFEITEPEVQAVNSNMHKVVAADALLKAKQITSSVHEKMIKESQVMRQDGQYQSMPLRICPKLPKQSAGQQLISTYNCRHYCLDSMVFDDEPLHVYCAETLWRKHVMDKFSREWKNEDGEWVGGYINNRFYKFPTAGTPDNPDVPRDHGNKMQLAQGERTRQPRPHEYSIERRLEENRDEGSTKSILLTQASSKGMVKLASSSTNTQDETALLDVFGKLVDLNNSGLDRDAAAAEMVKQTGWSAEKIVKLQSLAIRKMKVHQADVYSIIMGKKADSSNKQVKTAQTESLLQVPEDPPIEAITPQGRTPIEPGTVLIDKGGNEFAIYNPEGQPGANVTLDPDARTFLLDYNGVLTGAEEVGLI